MERNNTKKFKFDYIVAFNKGKTLLARIRNKGKLSFCLVLSSGHAYTRSEDTETGWDILEDNEGEAIRSQINQAAKSGINIFQFYGSPMSII